MVACWTLVTLPNHVEALLEVHHTMRTSITQPLELGGTQWAMKTIHYQQVRISVEEMWVIDISRSGCGFRMDDEV